MELGPVSKPQELSTDVRSNGVQEPVREGGGGDATGRSRTYDDAFPEATAFSSAKRQRYDAWVGAAGAASRGRRPNRVLGGRRNGLGRVDEEMGEGEHSPEEPMVPKSTFNMLQGRLLNMGRQLKERDRRIISLLAPDLQRDQEAPIVDYAKGPSSLTKQIGGGGSRNSTGGSPSVRAEHHLSTPLSPVGSGDNLSSWYDTLKTWAFSLGSVVAIMGFHTIRASLVERMEAAQGTQPLPNNERVLTKLANQQYLRARQDCIQLLCLLTTIQVLVTLSVVMCSYLVIRLYH